MRKELENRLIEFAVSVIDLCEKFENNYIGNHLADQIMRSATSAALNYGEAQSAESKKDFIHKISIVLKELRETNVNLKIISRSRICSVTDRVAKNLDESNQLVSIFYRTIITAKKNDRLND